MRRPHVFGRSAPRGPRASRPVPAPEAEAARHVADALPDLIKVAESGGHTTLAYLLDLAKIEAEAEARCIPSGVPSTGHQPDPADTAISEPSRYMSSERGLD